MTAYLHRTSIAEFSGHRFSRCSSNRRMYLRLRAAGKAVRGDVLLARVRPRPWVLKVRFDIAVLCHIDRACTNSAPHTAVGCGTELQLGDKRRSHPVLRADSYPLAELASASAACAPSQLYARHLGASFVACLPTSIRCSRWLLFVMHRLEMTQHLTRLRLLSTWTNSHENKHRWSPRAWNIPTPAQVLQVCLVAHGSLSQVVRCLAGAPAQGAAG